MRIILLAVLLGAVGAGFALIPAGTRLPIHWGANGLPDGFASRETALLWPVGIVAFVWAVMLILMRVAPAGETKGGRHATGVVLTGLTGLFAVIEIVTVLIGLGFEIEMVRALGFALAVLLVVLGNALPKSQPNSIAGIRIPTTLGDPANWQATHRFTGWLCMAGGVALAVAAALAPFALLIWFLVACVAVPMIAGTLYSRRLARRHGRI
ncbi:MAG: SdpI family protein [Devosia sp.]|uniref:SdpI family protein n=1 Tax=Devosia sp. TaxID=1871048 RepID=UPI001ACB78A6|nr:SdpI family protein [Devosia sp.]MBN9308583.1 SdpI family protein [Devosia sp.]MBN9317792.1 SdpI family protein [Devosia sp.]